MTKAGFDLARLPLADMSDVMEKPPFIVVYADPGFGKSTGLAISFAGHVGGSGALFGVTSKTVLRPYASWCELNRQAVDHLKLRTLLTPNPKWTPAKQKAGEEKAYLPIKRAWDDGGMAVYPIPALKEDGVTSIDACDMWKTILTSFCEARIKGNCPYNGFVGDEGSEFGDRWLESIDVQYANEIKKNNYERWNYVRKWMTWLKSIPRSADCFLGLACHVTEPTYWTAEDRQPQRTGDLKYPGGPAMPGGKARAALFAAADVVLRGVVKKKGGGLLDDDLGLGDDDEEPKTTLIDRVWMTEADPVWLSKIRAFGIAPEETRGLRTVLTSAGYKLW